MTTPQGMTACKSYKPREVTRHYVGGEGAEGATMTVCANCGGLPHESAARMTVEQVIEGLREVENSSHLNKYRDQIKERTGAAISLIQSQAAELAGLRAEAKEIEKATARECAEIAEANENFYTRNLIRTRFNLEDQP